jgi:hypothetical protein
VVVRGLIWHGDVMTDPISDPNREKAATTAIAAAIRRAWPARSMEKFAAGWSNLFLVALRADPAGRTAVAAALLDEETLADALDRALAGADSAGFVDGRVHDVHVLAREILATLKRMGETPET